MRVLLTGPAEGYLNPLLDYAEQEKANWIVSVGDFGIWPDRARMDRAGRQHHGEDFPRKYHGLDTDIVKIPILTIAGVHDDNRWLRDRKASGNLEILPNVHWLAQGYRTTIGYDGPACRVTGLGRAYSESTYMGHGGKRQYRHYTRRDVERACSSGPTDLLVVYEHLDAPGIRNVIFATRPKLIVTAEHPGRKVHSDIQGIDVLTLGRQEAKLVEWKDDRFQY